MSRHGRGRCRAWGPAWGERSRKSRRRKSRSRKPGRGWARRSRRGLAERRGKKKNRKRRGRVSRESREKERRASSAVASHGRCIGARRHHSDAAVGLCAAFMMDTTTRTRKMNAAPTTPARSARCRASSCSARRPSSSCWALERCTRGGARAARQP